MTDDQQPAPDPSNTQDVTALLQPLDPDDDVHERIAAVNAQRGAHLEDDDTRP